MDGTRLPIPIAGKRIKTFNKQKHEEPYIEDLKIDNNDEEPDVDSKVKSEILIIIVDFKNLQWMVLRPVVS